MTNKKISNYSRSRLRFGGRLVPAVLQLVLQEFNLVPAAGKSKDLKKEFPNVKDFGDLIKTIQNIIPKSAFVPATEYGLPNEKRGRETFTSVVDIVEQIKKSPILSRLKLVVYDQYGVEHKGKFDALEAVRKYEVKTIEDIMKNGGGAAYVSFQYFGTIDILNGLLIIDLNETDEQVQFSP